MSIKHKVKKALPYSMLISSTNVLLSMVTMIFLVRYLEGVQYGILAIILGMPLMIHTYSSLGYDSYITRFMISHEQRKEIAEVFWNIFFKRLLVTLIISGILILLFDVIAESFGLSGYYIHFVVFQLGVVSQIGSRYVTKLLNARYHQKYEFFLTNIDQILKAILVIFGAISGKSFLYFVIVISISSALKLFFGIIFCSKLYGRPILKDIITRRKENKEEKDYRRISYVNEIGTSFLATDIDRYILAYFSNNMQVAIYAIATNIVRKISTFMPITIFKPLIEPAFYSKADESDDNFEINRMFHFVFKLNILAGCFVLAMFIPFGEDLLKIVFSQDYVLKAYYPLIIFIVFLTAQSMPLGIVVKAIKKPKILLISKVSIVLSIGLGIPMAYHFGAVGMAYSTATSVFLKNCIMYYLVKKDIILTLPWKSIFLSVLNMLVIILILVFLNNLIHLYSILIGIVLYAVLMKMNSALEKKERDLFYSFMPEKFLGLSKLVI